MREKKGWLMKKSQKSANKGFEVMLGSHTKALEDNSKSLVEILEVLSEKNLSLKNKESLKKITRELKSIDRKVDSLGMLEEQVEDDWFSF